jgi:hypothetical protein
MINPSDFDLSQLTPDASDGMPNGDLPTFIDVLPTGDEVLVIGDVPGTRDFNHLQGDNPFGLEGTCGLVSCEDVLRQFGLSVGEGDIVYHAVEQGECYVGDDPASSGGTSSDSQAQILSDYGIPAHAEQVVSTEQLADYVEGGHGVIAEVNAGVLWDDPNYYGFGEANHAIVVTGVARDPSSGELQGVYVNDSGRGYPEDSGRFIDLATWEKAQLQPGGECVVTDGVRPALA